MKRKEFMKYANLKNTWNSTFTFKYNNKEYIIATVMWQDLRWKLVSTKEWELIKDREDKSYIIKEVYSQQDLWEYMRDNIFNN